MSGRQGNKRQSERSLIHLFARQMPSGTGPGSSWDLLPGLPHSQLGPATGAIIIAFPETHDPEAALGTGNRIYIPIWDVGVLMRRSMPAPGTAY